MVHPQGPPPHHDGPRTRRVALSLLLVVLALASAPGCRREPPEAALRAAVADLQAAVDARDASDVAAWLSDDFIGPGGMDRDATRRYAAMVFLRHREIASTLGPLDIVLQDDHARVRFTTALAGGDGGLLPDAARVRAVETGWRLESGEWRLLSASWED